LGLTRFIQGEDAWKPAQWEELVLRLLAETIKVAADDDWTLQLGECLTAQLDSYKGDSNLKVFYNEIVALAPYHFVCTESSPEAPWSDSSKDQQERCH